MAANRFKVVSHGKKTGIFCRECQRTTYDWCAVRDRYCPVCEQYLETDLERRWRRFKEQPEYQAGAPGMGYRRMSVADKIWSRFYGLLLVVGVVWLLLKVIGSML